MKRRDFLRVLGILSGSTLMSSCGSRKTKDFVSSVLPPEEGVIPGEAYFSPSTCTECPAGCGLSVKRREGWPIKLEGAPGHPVNDGGLCIRGQSSLTRLYHPKRVEAPMLRNGDGKFKAISWEKALSQVSESLAGSRDAGRKNLFLSGRTTGSLSLLIDVFCAKLGVERLPEFEVYSYSAVAEANGLLFGERDVPHYRIENADFLLTVGVDILATHVSPVSYARKLSQARSRGDFRWFHAEPHLSLTGANADRRFVVLPGREAVLLAYLLRQVLDRGPRRHGLPREAVNALPRFSVEKASEKTGIPSEELAELADRMTKARFPLVIAGGVSTSHRRGLEVAALAGMIQWVTGEIPGLIDFARNEKYGGTGTFRDMEALSTRLSKGEGGVLFLSRTNPVFSLPGGFAFRENVRKAKLSVAFGDLLDETMQEADLILPLSHSLESWGDVEPRRGVVSLVKPVLASLHDTLSEGDILLRLMGAVSREGTAAGYREHLFAEWTKRFGEKGRDALYRNGFVEESLPAKRVTLDGRKAAVLLKEAAAEGGEPRTPVLVLTPSLRTFDGRSRGLPLLSEIPDPLTTISYGRWLSVSSGTAKALGVTDREEVTVSSGDWSQVLPVKIQPGLAEGVFVASRDFVDAPPLRTEERTGEATWYLEGIGIEKSGRIAAIPILSGSPSQRGRGLIPDPSHRGEKHHHGKESLYPEHEHREYRWAMAIDLALCNGCSACVAACYIENNVPVVGKKDHLKGREMSWLRIEPFYGKAGNVDFLPMLCQQCHSAPCETVCPVYAAYHNPEGLNVQVYNRCVGTRYCSNNCPYKVRRFNWFWHMWKKPLDRMLNPDLEVRGAGVMEKCTFCIQRIRAAKDRAKDDSRKVRDGEVSTACAQSCPTGAITFGNLLDPESNVYRQAHLERAYRVFEGLGTNPSVYYLGGAKGGPEREGHG
jgi:anaerobic selenocysteine-containing dehydrogenase/Fe-S-cluster-containing dehydrogenase component